MKCSRNDCDKDADVTVDGVPFCMNHYHDWHYKQDKAHIPFEFVIE